MMMMIDDDDDGQLDDLMMLLRHSDPDRKGSWQDAHHFCRSRDGFLASRDEYSLLTHAPYLSNGTHTWTALTPLHGHYQWFSRCPASTDFTAWRGGRVPRAWDRSCAALDVATMEFELTPCSSVLPVLCFLEPGRDKGLEAGALDDVELVLAGDPAPGPTGHLNLSREAFENTSLTCTAYTRSTGRPLDPQPRVFWRKDLVYSGHCTASLIPATLHDRTKSPADWDAAHQDPFTTQQGTYWCEAWGAPGGSARLVSNKVLLTLQDILVFILEAHRKEASNDNLTESHAKTQLRTAFFREIPSIEDYALDLVRASKTPLPSAPHTVLANYTFHLHIPRSNIQTHWQTMAEALRDRAKTLTEVFSIYKYEKSSRVVFPYLCLSCTSPGWGNGAPDLKWPSTFVGPVHPNNARCEVPHGRLAAAGRCMWNYTHGAHFVFDSEPCRWRDLCPQGYDAATGSHCLAVQPASSWQEGFEAVYTTSQELSLLSETVLRSRRIWRHVRRLVKVTAATDTVWLPDRRLRPGAPLQHLGPPPSNGYNHTEHISWAEGHPLPDFECLALNLTARTLHTHPCTARLPFPALVQVPFMGRKRIRRKPQLWKESTLCRGWQSPTIKGANEVCFNLFRNVGNQTWDEAQNFCLEQGADLPAPNVGFLDWVYRQELWRQGVEGVWMSPHWVPERVVYKGPEDILGWTADTDYTLRYGELTPRGWLLRSGGTREDVLCQRLLKPTERLRLKVLPPATPAAESLCVEADPWEMLAGGKNPVLQCFVNGQTAHVTGLQASGPPECVAKIERNEPGYYQCVGWTVAPVMLAASNTILESPSAMTFLVTLLEPEVLYDPLQHDATFTLARQSCGCCETFNATLANSAVAGITELTARRQHLLADPDGRLLHGIHVECRGVASTLSEPQVLEFLKSLLALGQQVGACTVQAVRSTQGCEREVTVNEWEQGPKSSAGNLTWPSTVGAQQVVPEEPCVTSTGEPVTRECAGDFLLGYSWGPAGHCTGTVSNLTRKLWRANRDPRDSLEKTELALRANISALQPVDIFLVAKTLEAAAEAPTPNLRLAQLVSVMDSVLAADAAAFMPVQQRLGSSDTLLEAFEKLFLKLNSTDLERQPQLKSGTCWAVEGVALAPESHVIGYKSREKSVRGLREETLVVGVSKADLEDAAAAIILPQNISLLVAARKQTQGREAGNVTMPLFFAVYRNDKLFQESNTAESLDDVGGRYQVNSEVIQATFGTEVYGLQEDVEIYFKPRLPGNDTKCVFWDLRARGNRGGWSEEGCHSGGLVGDHHLCLCNHLTCFAELINYDDSAGFSGTHATVLNTITVVGCCLSLLGLLLVFFTFLLFQRWRRPLSNKILVNLCFAEFCSLTVFLAGVDQTVSGPLCRGVAVALHYFILASFGWMLVEAVHQYLNFVKVVGTYIPRFMWKASVCAWGVPLLPILAVLVYDSSLYDHDGSGEDGNKICWMSSTGFWVAMLPPLAATMGVNLVMYGLILYGVTCGRTSVPSTLPERALLMNQLRMAVCVFFLLGLTWVFGLLAVSSARLVFSYLFCTFTTFKGFLLFVFHVCRERGARRYWEDFLSVLKHESSASSPGDSAHAANSNGRPARHGASFNPCGGIMVLPPVPTRRQRTSVRTSLISVRSSSTPGGSRASFYP
ncbi:Adhesion G-protein coupled receptor G4 [Chionoecetes opilio]|uniref:Adhesion G-protein coupled receptor G4 n=1 Tax=Chionoecetes opilio TaxID=41210 RepID=A0A8J4XNG1_CHIOP|nr:Adhesion G-protein coupled receptor G4 [Chionoecetes opilio]